MMRRLARRVNAQKLRHRNLSRIATGPAISACSGMHRSFSATAASSSPERDLTRIRNVAVIAHVDHGKTTLVDKLLQSAGTAVDMDRAMDSNEIERERGITVFSKVCGLDWRASPDAGEDGPKLSFNLVDSPGHADFGGEVERIQSMVDAVILVVCAREGPMAQTRYVLEKALRAGHKPILVVNKADRPDARNEEVPDEVLDLMMGLDATEEQLEFPVLYASAKEGWATEDPAMAPESIARGMEPLLDAMVQHTPPPRVALRGEDLNNTDNPAEGMNQADLKARADAAASEPFRMLVTQIAVDPFVGKLARGRVTAGRVAMGDNVRLVRRTGGIKEDDCAVTRVQCPSGLGVAPRDYALAGDVVELAGVSLARPTDTIVCAGWDEQADGPPQLPATPIDPPVLSMMIGVNDSPLAGKEGSELTGSVLQRRLEKEAEGNVSIQVRKPGTSVSDKKGDKAVAEEGEETSMGGEDDEDAGMWERVDVGPAGGGVRDGMEVFGRGELQLSVLLETMRREGFEMSVAPPRVVLRKHRETKQVQEPYEEVTLDVSEDVSGTMIEAMQQRKGELQDFTTVAGGGSVGSGSGEGDGASGRARLVFHVPSRSLLGFQAEFRSLTRGDGVLTRRFDHFGDYHAEARRQPRGVLVSSSSGTTTAHALSSLEARGILFVGPSTDVYEGMLIGECAKPSDLVVNPVRAKKLTNVRAAGSDEMVRLAPPRQVTLEDAITYVRDDELVELTPSSIRMRKRVLNADKRKAAARSGSKGGRQ